jgi:acylphosphatase
MADAARRIRVTGRVQGVFFRDWAQQQARELGVSGWVRNCSDGSVEAHLEGEDSAVDQLVGRMRQGPPSARVEDVRVEEAEPEGFSGFQVRH